MSAKQEKRKRQAAKDCQKQVDDEVERWAQQLEERAKEGK